MIKAIQYLHGPNWLPACVTCLSLRKNGQLKDATYTLYTTDDSILTNPYVRAVFDCVQRPICPWQTVWSMNLHYEMNHPSHKGSIKAWPKNFRKFALTKYLCFLWEPCEGNDKVMFLDNDTLITGDVNPAFPQMGWAWSARSWTNRCRRINGGVLAKKAGFPTEHFTEPVLSEEKLLEALKISRLDDEACAAWTMVHYGDKDLWPLARGYNHMIACKPDGGEVIWHFTAPEKPWLGRYLDVNRSAYERWESTAREVCEMVGYPLDGAGVREEWKWPGAIGESEKTANWKFRM